VAAATLAGRAKGGPRRPVPDLIGAPVHGQGRAASCAIYLTESETRHAAPPSEGLRPRLLARFTAVEKVRVRARAKVMPKGPPMAPARICSPDPLAPGSRPAGQADPFWAVPWPSQAHPVERGLALSQWPGAFAVARPAVAPLGPDSVQSWRAQIPCR
jgi:hypothetical protein